jgi:hypothetical protein
VRRGGEVLEQVQEGGLRPVEVLDDDHQRLSPGNGLEQPPQRAKQHARVSGLVDHAHYAGNLGGGGGGVGVVGEQLCQALQP